MIKKYITTHEKLSILLLFYSNDLSLDPQQGIVYVLKFFNTYLEHLCTFNVHGVYLQRYATLAILVRQNTLGVEVVEMD